MPFKDLDVYLAVARALLAGQNPYAVAEAYYPLPFYFIFVPLAYLAPNAAHTVWTAVEALSLVAILRGRAAFALFFAPVVLAFVMGQIDLPMLGMVALLCARKFGGVALGILMLKPQLAIFIVPWQIWRWWRDERAQLAWWLGTLGVLGGAAFLVEPAWLSNWLMVSGERLRAPLSPSLWGALSWLPFPYYWFVGGAFTIGVLIWAYRRNDFTLIALANFLVNPVIISYDLALLSLFVLRAREWLWVIVVSWLAFGISAAELWRGEGPAVLNTLAILGIVLWRHAPRARVSVLSRASKI